MAGYKVLLLRSIPMTLLLALYGCGDTENSAPTSSSHTETTTRLAVSSALTVASQSAGPTPFIALVQLTAAELSGLQQVNFVIAPLPGTASQPVSVTYTLTALQNRGRVSGTTITLPVFGLYAGHTNSVTITSQFTDQSSTSSTVSIAAPSYASPTPLGSPTKNVARAQGSQLGFNYFLVKAATIGPATIMDSDGYIRWVSTTPAGQAIEFRDNGLDITNSNIALYREEMDGTSTSFPIGDTSVAAFNHNLEIGKEGIFADVNVTGRLEDELAELSPNGSTLKTWDMVQIIGDYMRSQGDDPTNFVRPGADWFHMNSAAYDASDNSVIISSRENFVIKLDYDSGQIKWILGDTTKYWYQFSSLRQKALQIVGKTLAPVGQHALSITSDGQLLLFNDGYPSLNQPSNAPAGITRSFSAVTGYVIDPVQKTASQGYYYDDNKSVYSPICSSGYLSSGRSVLIDYAESNNFTTARLKGLNPQGATVFDFSFPTNTGCGTAWNSQIVPMENMYIAT